MTYFYLAATIFGIFLLVMIHSSVYRTMLGVQKLADAVVTLSALLAVAQEVSETPPPAKPAEPTRLGSARRRSR